MKRKHRIQCPTLHQRQIRAEIDRRQAEGLPLGTRYALSKHLKVSANAVTAWLSRPTRHDHVEAMAEALGLKLCFVGEVSDE